MLEEESVMIWVECVLLPWFQQ